MTLQELVIRLKNDGWTDYAVESAIMNYLRSRNYSFKDITVICIRRQIKRYHVLAEVA